MVRKLSIAIPLAIAACSFLGTTLALANGWSS
jgi:hypothetical protein